MRMCQQRAIWERKLIEQLEYIQVGTFLQSGVIHQSNFLSARLVGPSTWGHPLVNPTCVFLGILLSKHSRASK